MIRADKAICPPRERLEEVDVLLSFFTDRQHPKDYVPSVGRASGAGEGVL